MSAENHAPKCPTCGSPEPQGQPRYGCTDPWHSAHQASPKATDSLDSILGRLQRFREDRGWESDHTPRSLAVSIAVEAGELLEHFQWSEHPPKANDLLFVSAELADVLIYALNLAQVLGLDPAKAVNDKITKNELRFPAPGATRPVGGV